jgi:hypothetical protein
MGYNSKRVYVQSRLAGVGTTELFRIARAVVEEFGDEELERLIAGDGFRGVDGELKNLIFAAVGPKPRIVLHDAISNVIEIVDGADRCLVYDRPLMPTGLTWGDLLTWWREQHQAVEERDAAKALYRRLAQSLASPPSSSSSRRTASGTAATTDAGPGRRRATARATCEQLRPECPSRG